MKNSKRLIFPIIAFSLYLILISISATRCLSNMDIQLLAADHSQEQGYRININTASVAELDSLPGIGMSLAEEIVRYRLLNGPFQEITDLLNVPGIGNEAFAALKDYIIVR